MQTLGITGRFISGKFRSSTGASLWVEGPVDNSPGRQVLTSFRPALRPALQTPQTPPFVYPPSTPPDSAKFWESAKYDHPRDSDWSDTEKSRTPTRTRRARSTGRPPMSTSPSRRLLRRPRSNSFSTVENVAGVHVSRTGDYKIVIDHPNPASKNASLPTIEVPIPHYRLGTPRFSARGTAFLHSSIYTRASTAEDVASSVMTGIEYDRLFPIPPVMESRSILPRRHSHASPQPYSVQITTVKESKTNDFVSSSPAFHRPKEPIVPAIFDTMALNPDDPAIVRYSPATGEITAASPARIVAQITSKNFLDYELLSDFFLTVRSYLSTHDLLAYLLARFEWAINRFDDDGRVIRVRAFAALRHWILNYFPYDFVGDRELRLRFCDRLNALSRTVHERSIHGPSDLKLILDLKKCWNGRCALYWDVADNEGRHDIDISAGGIVGSRDSELTHPSQLWTRLADSPRARIDNVVDPKESAAALNNWFDAVIEAEDNRNKTHERQVSGVTSRSLPTSPISEQSIQAMSCTLPGKGIKKMMAQSNRSPGVHPIPVPMAVRKVCPAAPSAVANDRPIQAHHAHKRSGSFSDAFRDKRASLPSMRAELSNAPVMMAFPFSGSLIRGSVIPPGSPYLDALILTTPVSDARSVSSRSDDSETIESSKFSSPLSPGVKNLFGSIRRALSMKQVSGPPTTMTGSGAQGSSKYSNLPLQVPNHREQQSEQRYLDTAQNQSRIDLLCAEVAEVYQRAFIQPQQQELRPMNSTEFATPNEYRKSSSELRNIVYSSAVDPLPPANSEVTYGSRSILVYNDTGDAPPIPDLPTHEDILAAEERSRQFRIERPESLVSPATSVAQDLHQPGPSQHAVKNSSQRSTKAKENSADHVEISRKSHRPRPSMAQSFKSTYSGSRSLRKYASYQSGITRSAPPASESQVATYQSDKAPGRMLRRRPGGDLRANQNVHDLEMIPRPRSAGSVTTYTDSLRASELFMNNTAKNSLKYRSPVSPLSPVETIAPATKAVSLVRTHSSQPALRPSFEAAVAEFARIPDDEGGDIEATLLKLEGKYRRSPPAQAPTAPLPNDQAEDSTASIEPKSDELNKLDEHVQPKPDESYLSSDPTYSRSLEDLRGDATPTGERSQSYRYNMASSLYAESEESYNSTPLLERGISPKSNSTGKAEANKPTGPIPQPLFSHNNSQIDYESNLVSPFGEPGVETDSQMRRRYRSSIPTTTDSFLLDEDEFLSDLSSEISTDDHRERANEPVFGPQPPKSSPHRNITPPKVGYITASSAHPPPTPPMAKDSANAIISQAYRIQDQRKPPTPRPSPDNDKIEQAKASNPDITQVITPQPSLVPILKYPTYAHLPFVLTFEASVIAEQFTIIEKDALNEINWQDLINMRWHHTSPSTLNWVDYLITQNPTGIELVTARFNIMVKWVLSEIVLTNNVEERALVVTKYIHVAKHARKIHNYATMLQLTIALTSVDCARLHKTWELVPGVEKKALKDLENLVTPIRNFNNLRQEMETANADEGCIPVVGKEARTVMVCLFPVVFS